MSETLFEMAKAYVDVIRKIERTSDPKELQRLEEKRADLHWKFSRKLRSEGIQVKDKDHATGIAIKIVNREL